MYVTLISTQASTWFIPTLHKEKKKQMKKTKQNKLFFYIFTSLHSKSGSTQWKIWNDKFENKKLVSPSFMVYLLGLN